MYIKRDLQIRLKDLIDTDEVLAIVGPRQSGKTTLLRKLEEFVRQKGREVEFITFEKKQNLRLFSEIEEFKEYYRGTDVVLIDEFQYADEAGQKLKYLYDTTDIKFVITGSSSLDLIHNTGKYMVGRMFTFSLHPFSFREFLRAKDQDLLNILEDRFPNPLDQFNPKEKLKKALSNNLESLFEEYLIYGGYPKVVLNDNKDRKRLVLENNLNNYLRKEIKDLLNLASDDSLIKLAESLSAQIGKLINYNNLSEVAELTHNKTKEHLNILTQTYVCELIRPFFTSKKKEIVKNPVPYFIDTGFRNYLIDDFRDLRLRNDMGSLVENYVFMALKRRQNTGLKKINYWRSKSQAEVDFVIKDRKPVPIEVKYRSNPAPGKSFYSFLDKYEPDKGYVITKDKAEIKESESTTIYFVPAYYL